MMSTQQGRTFGVAAVALPAAVWAVRAARRRLTRVRASVTINRNDHEVYRSWRSLEDLPSFMEHLQAVRVTDSRRSHWVAKGPMGWRVEWDAEIIADQPGRLVAWRSLPGTAVPNRGSVQFTPAPGQRGTEVRVDLQYLPPVGALGRTIAALFGAEPGRQVRDDLRRFKQMVETGEVVSSDGCPRGTGARHQLLRRPAQPVSSPDGAVGR